MKLADSLAKRANDPAHQAAAAELKLTLDLANRILDLRIARAWTQAELGKALGATAHFVAELEARRHSPSVGMLGKLALAFGVELEVRLG